MRKIKYSKHMCSYGLIKRYPCSLHKKSGRLAVVVYFSAPKNSSRSSSTVPIPEIPKFSTKVFATFGLRNAGRVGPRWIFFTQRYRSARRTITAFYCLNNRICQSQNLRMGKSADEFPCFNFSWCSAFFSMFNHPREIFLFTDFPRNMGAARISGYAGGIKSVLVAVPGRYDAVGRHQNGYKHLRRFPASAPAAFPAPAEIGYPRFGQKEHRLSRPFLPSFLTLIAKHFLFHKFGTSIKKYIN